MGAVVCMVPARMALEVVGQMRGAGRNYTPPCLDGVDPDVRVLLKTV
jgi:hypothetical protein